MANGFGEFWTLFLDKMDDIDMEIVRFICFLSADLWDDVVRVIRELSCCQLRSKQALHPTFGF